MGLNAFPFTHGQALNITCQSYAGYISGCHSSMPSMQRLAVYTADAPAELEATFLPDAAKPAAARKAAAEAVSEAAA